MLLVVKNYLMAWKSVHNKVGVENKVIKTVDVM